MSKYDDLLRVEKRVKWLKQLRDIDALTTDEVQELRMIQRHLAVFNWVHEHNEDPPRYPVGEGYVRAAVAAVGDMYEAIKDGAQ